MAKGYSRWIIVILLYAALLPETYAQSRTIMDFNEGWKFLQADDSLAMKPGYNDSKWRTLSLPHDWSIEGAFNEKHPATTQGGALPGGAGWYRKSFISPATSMNRQVSIEFDGIYRNSEVWINGHYLGKRPNGYISFYYDLSPYLRPAPSRNVIAVKVDNSQQPNSRWYTGSGIYRNVRMVITHPVAIAAWGTFIHSSLISGDKGEGTCGRALLPGETVASISLHTTIKNRSGRKQTISALTRIYDHRNKEVAKTTEYKVETDTFETRLVSGVLIANPRLWSVDSPVLYKAVTQLFQGGRLIDNYETRFGIRSFYFDTARGFFLNDKPLKILGVCMHHDLGALGAAVNTRAIERQLEILKKMGCNAIRTAHNPPAPELLDLCDRMGFLVMDEAFDMWRKKKNKYDYYADFDEWHTTDLQDMVRRDRNHPSVFMWSIGNEIREQFDSSGIRITRELVNTVKAMDSTRPVTAALSEWDPKKNFMYQSGALDVIGLNYHHEVYDDLRRHYPGQKLIGAENMSALATRGHYDFPSDTLMHWPAKSPQKFVEKGNPDWTVSAYDQVSAYWGSTHEATWKLIKKHDYLSGLFVWTGFDYLGEPTPYPWPARSSYFGIVDLAGFPKDVYYMYRGEWTKEPVLHLFPHWNWQRGQTVDVWAYYNNADEVELFLNGRSLGIRKKEGEELHVMWRVAFEPGMLKAVSRKNGKTVLAKQVKTAGAPARIELTADRRVIKTDGKDLSFITVRILDKDGNLVPDANNLLQFSVSGAGMLAGTDNGYQADTVSLKSSRRMCWKGMALAIVQSAGKKGNITLKVVTDGLPAVILSLKAAD